jgi:MFS transporter, DHA2 family, multidrug resistance protein
MTVEDAPPRAGRREWIGLAVLALPTLLVSLDLFVMLLAVPHLSADLGASSTQQLWILDIYGFMVAGFLITMGTVGDRIGRRRLLLVGAAAFGLASVLAAWSTSPQMLIASRALLGIAGATLTPSTLSLITNLFRDPRQRASAVAVWAGCFVVGAIIGPIVGGLLLEQFWWGSVFLLGVPAMVLLLLTGPVLLPEYRNPQADRLDRASVALSLGVILPVIFGLKELARGGWQPLSMVAVVVGVVVGVAFVRRQRALADPLLDLGLFANRAFSVTLGSMLAYSMLSGGTMVWVAQQLQLVVGLSPLRAGLALVPGMVAAIGSFQLAPLLARRIRPAYLFSGGLLVAVAGLLVLTQTSATAGPAVLIGGFVLASFGGGPLVALGTNLVVSSAPPEKAGSAAGVAQTGNELGYALGIATLGSIGTAVYRTQIADAIPTGIPAAAADAARDTLAGATAAAASLPDQVAAPLLAVARDAFTVGLHVVALVAAAVLAGIAVLIMTTLRHLTPIGQAESSPAAAPATAADPPLQQNPGSEQPRPRTPPAGPGDGAWARLAAHKENAMGTEAASTSTTSPTRARRAAGGSTAPASRHGWRR